MSVSTGASATSAPRGRVRRAVLVAVAAAALVVPVLVTPTAPAVAQASVVLEGKGYGHGRGMSQHGAQGRATAGHTWQQILAFYYPGVVRTVLADSDIRVWISADSNNNVTVLPVSGLRVTNGGTHHTLPTGADYTQWRLTRGATVFKVQYRDRGGSWRDHMNVTSSRETAFTVASGILTLVRSDGVQQELRGGHLRAVPHGAAPGMRTVAVMQMEDYLRSVVPREMPALWHANALRAQSVAARTYASALRADARSKGQAWDTCDTVSCQVFYGVAQTRTVNGRAERTAGEHANTDAAIHHTRTVVMTYGSGFPLAEFSAANGGYTVASSRAYQVAKADTYDTYTWRTSVPVSTIERAYPAIGTFQGFGRITRDGNGAWGGRVVSAVLTGSKGSVTATGADLRSKLGLQSTWFRTTYAHFDTAKDWNGDGQPDVLSIHSNGALGMAPSDGRGGFGSRVQIGRGWQAMDQVGYIHNFDGDGRQGLLARRISDGTLWLYPATGDGGFGSARRIGTGWSSIVSITPVENWRHRGDVGVLAEFADGSLYLYPGNGRGGWQPRVRVGTGWQRMDQITFAGNWDGTGRPQVVAVEKATGTLWLYPGNGRGGWESRRAIGKGWTAVSTIVGGGDWNRDGHVDLLGQMRSGGAVYVYPGNGRGGFLSRTPLSAQVYPRLVG